MHKDYPITADQVSAITAAKSVEAALQISGQLGEQAHFLRLGYIAEILGSRAIGGYFVETKANVNAKFAKAWEAARKPQEVCYCGIKECRARKYSDGHYLHTSGSFEGPGDSLWGAAPGNPVPAEAAKKYWCRSWGLHPLTEEERASRRFTRYFGRVILPGVKFGYENLDGAKLLQDALPEGFEVTPAGDVTGPWGNPMTLEDIKKIMKEINE